MISKILKALPVFALFCYFCQAQGNQATALKPNELAPTHKDISYGSHPKELINFWQFDSDQPVGVLLQIHGGGWMGGKKGQRAARTRSPERTTTQLTFTVSLSVYSSAASSAPRTLA